MADDDEELMREINRQADRAEEMRPARMDRYALAATLAGRFQQHGTDEIEKMITGVWLLPQPEAEQEQPLLL
ncbi:hypothetical protein [Phyllobacterium zundukense]|uniref:Uncharacterized protein n=1 Tax=Phyllobacterium zundukense TaxID=1867719 RepID=A0ACD4CZU9_9HYPH|nr:hypothetical protein [Phyllobacterium zundukense]UXN59151.1 hypothetical protein N8E88_09810 [Phyllobacterium zundukense]